MKPLNLKETALKEEMKKRCLAKGQYIDENAKAKFDMLCHLEDFEVQYWELQQENKQLKGIIKENTILVKDEYGDYQECNINPLRMKQKYEKQVDNWNKLKEIAKSQSGFKKRADLKGGLWFEIDELLDKMQELEQGGDSNEKNDSI